MNNLVVTLTQQDLLELQAILIDRDQPRALVFLEERIAPRIPQKGTLGCDSTRKNPFLLKRK